MEASKQGKEDEGAEFGRSVAAEFGNSCRESEPRLNDAKLHLFGNSTYASYGILLAHRLLL